jgi:hypothetical protein
MMLYFTNLLAKARKPALVFSLTPLLLLSGCQRKPDPAISERGSVQKPVQTPAQFVPAPEANIFVDDAMLAKPYAVIGGTVQNVGNERLEKLSVAIELRRRTDGSVERREVAVEPGELEPGKQGRYKLKVLSDEWSGSRVVSLRSGVRTEEIAFKTMPGAKRPPEKLDGKVVIVKTPAPKKSNGGDFINTPDNPFKVP